MFRRVFRRVFLVPCVLIGTSATYAGAMRASPVPPSAPTSAGVQDTLRAGGVVVIHEPGDLGMAERVVRGLDGMSDLPGLPPEAVAGVVVVLADDEASFEAAVGGAVPEWGAGVALPAEGRIVLPAYASNRSRGRDLASLLRHEWAHVALGRHLAGLRIPHWFHEGYAEWASGGFDASEAWRLRVIMAMGRTPPLDSLTLDWPADRASAEVAYLLAGSAVEYLASGSGPEGLRTFLARWRDEGAFESAFRGTFGLTTAQFEEDWARHVKRRYGWLLVLSHSLVFWASAAVLLVLLAWIRRRRTRERLARMRASDPPPTPVFWTEVGDPGSNSGVRGGYPGQERPAPPTPEPGPESAP